MSVTDTCPQCGGHRHRILSPGLHQCENVVHWAEKELVTEYVTVDDPGMFHNFGLRGTKDVPQERWADVEKSRVCAHIYEVDTPMAMTPCQLGPDDKACGAFAVGSCSECMKPVCRYHASYFDSRLLCDPCKLPIEARRNEEMEARRAADAALADEQRRLWAEAKRQTRIEEHAAYDALPAMSISDWAQFMRTEDEFTDEEYPSWNGKRPTTLSLAEAVGVLTKTGFDTASVPTGHKKVLSTSIQTTEKGWFVSHESGTELVRFEDTRFTRWIILLESKRVVACRDYPGALRPTTAAGSEWVPGPREMADARHYLRAGGPNGGSIPTFRDLPYGRLSR